MDALNYFETIFRFKDSIIKLALCVTQVYCKQGFFEKKIRALLKSIWGKSGDMRMFLKIVL